jgi:dolichol-phosphate mannosyltransferase
MDLTSSGDKESSAENRSVLSEHSVPATLTVIVPVYNEAECLSRLVEEMNKFISISPVTTTVLFVNDGSRDNSQEIIEKICTDDPHYHFIKLQSNRGLSAALKAGIDHCNTSLVGYIDADIQTSPTDFLKLLEFIYEYELVTGIRVKRNDQIIKRISSTIANTVRRWLINDGIADTGCPLKVMWTKNARLMPFFTGMHRFIPALIQLQGGKVKQVPVQHFPRFAGKAKYNLRKRMIKPLVDTFAFRWMRSRYIRYQIEKQG